MLQLRKRWPALTAVAAVVAYGANHYQIGGLGQLRIEPRTRSASLEPSAANPYDTSAWPSGSDVFGTDVFGSEGFAPISEAYSGAGVGKAPPWSHQLSLAEKFAMWQDRTTDERPSAAASGPGGLASPALPTSTPISMPPGFAPSLGLPVGASASTSQAAGPFLPSTIPDTVFSLNSSQPQASTLDVGFGGRQQLSDKPAAQRLRVASFNLQGLGPAKLAKPELVELLVRILRQYEVVALQEIQSSRDDILPMLVERLNQSGRSYDYLVGPRVGGENAREQFAFLFDTSRVETDRYQLYTVEDPEELITYDPLVAWFRCKGVPRDRAFTFSVVNLRIDPSRSAQERELLPNLIHAIENDGRHEDDWLIVGDLNGGNSQLTHLNRESVRLAFSDIPTDVMGQSMRSCILFSARGTTEFTGRAGVFDFLQKFNLSLERALEVSEHMPVWAEFFTLEGADPGRIAPSDPSAVL